MFIGSWASGRVVDAYALGARHAWDRIWIVPSAGAFAVLLLFALFFSTSKRSPVAAAVSQS
jgi:hypothetical protein